MENGTLPGEMVPDEQLTPVENMTEREMLEEIVTFCRHASTAFLALENLGSSPMAKMVQSMMGGRSGPSNNH